jgi:hypothetical protein
MSYAGTVYEVVLQQWIPPAILARIASYDWLVTTVLSSLGLVLAGWLGDQLGVPQTLIGAAGIVAVAAGVALVAPTVRRADAAHAAPAPEPVLVPEPLLVLPDPPQPRDVVVTLPDPPSVWARPD